MMFATLLILTLVSARMAQLMAAGSGRSAISWMKLAVVFGPFALIALAALPRKSPLIQPSP